MANTAPTEVMLADYANGTASAGMSLLMAAHLTYSPESRRRIADLERLGGALLAAGDGEDAAPLDEAALGRVLGAIDAAPEADEPVPPTPAGDAVPLPRPVLDAIGTEFGRIRWGFRLPGLAAVDIEGDGDERISVLRARPGAKIPQHTHEGREFTLVLAGALRDGDTVYRPGDLDCADEHDDHCPEVDGDETCYCLIVMEGSLRFTGRFSRALNLLPG